MVDIGNMMKQAQQLQKKMSEVQEKLKSIEHIGVDNLNKIQELLLDICENCGGNGPKENMDCDGNCLVQVDCFGICDGEAKLDDCGKCDEDETNNCSKSYFDKCGTFDNDITNDCVEDCVGILKVPPIQILGRQEHHLYNIQDHWQNILSTQL